MTRPPNYTQGKSCETCKFIGVKRFRDSICKKYDYEILGWNVCDDYEN